MAPLATNCQLLGGLFSEGVQVGLGVLAVISLLVKRQLERPRRAWKVWGFDVSKQAAGALFAHLLNLGLAELLSHASAFQDQCAWYFINFFLDTTVGVGLAWVLLKCQEKLAVQCGIAVLQKSGDYGQQRSYKIWIVQLLAWMVIVLISKSILAAVMYGMDRQLSDIGYTLSHPFYGHPKVELVTVMVACPCLMNFLQFWIQDTFLKKRAPDESGCCACRRRAKTLPGTEALLAGASGDSGDTYGSHGAGSSRALRFERSDTHGNMPVTA